MVMKSDLSVDQAALAQSDAEPVAWQTRAKGAKAWYCHPGRPDIDEEFYEARPLYAAPPRPDAQSDAEPQETWNKQPPGPDSILHELGDCPAQSDAEPVAGGLAKARTIALEQRCERGTPWDLACVTIANKIGEQCGYPPIPTDTAPPRPDASAGLIETGDISEQVWQALCARADAFVGLIEAAEWHEEHALRFAASPYTSDKMRGMMHKEDAHKLRARAADRSRK